MPFFIAICIVLVFAVSPPVWADVYKWVDKHGKIHYTDKKTAFGKESAEVSIEVHNTHENPELKEYRERSRRQLKASEQERKLAQRNATKRRKKAQKHKKACNRAKKRYHRYQDSSFLFNTKGNGEQYIFSDQERDAILSDLKKSLKKHCS